LSSATNKHVEVIEVEPFPCLFQHMDDIRSEIEALNDESAKLDFKALEYTAAHFTDRWKEAREEDTSGGFVSYSNIWTIFKPGDLVLRKDALGNDWLLVLVDVKEYLEVKNNGARVEYTEFTTWYLGWNAVEGRLERKIVFFRISKYSDRRRIASLPVYPLSYKGEEVDSFLEKIAERGRKWKSLISCSTACRMRWGFSSPRIPTSSWWSSTPWSSKP